MGFGRALYYPHIHLTNKNWIKYALLYYDNLSRIVPSSIHPQDSEEIIRIRYETGFIDDHSPDYWEVVETFNDFGRVLDSFIDTSEFFDERYFRDYHRHRRRYMQDIGNRYDYNRESVLKSGTYLHIKKLDWRLKEKLFAIGMAIPGENEWEDWIKIDNEIGLLYMVFLAKTISKKQLLPIVTDLDTSFSSSIYLEPFFSNYDGDTEYKLGTLLVNNFLPKNINDVPLDKILEIREKYADERRAFYSSISELCDKLPQVENEEALKVVLNHYSNRISKEVDDLKKVYRSLKIETMNSFLTISVPSTIVSLSNYIPAEYKSISISLGIIFSLLSTSNAVRKKRLEMKSNPRSYLLNLQSEVGDSNFLKTANDIINGFRKW